MAYDEGLAQRLNEYFCGKPNVVDKKMFGGLCFMVSNHMCCGIVGDRLMARVGPKEYETCLSESHVKEMDFTGKSMKGMVYVTAEGLVTDDDLTKWVGICESFVRSLPAKVTKNVKIY